MWGLKSNRIMSGMSRSGRSRSRSEVVSNSNRPRGNELGEDRYIYHDIVKHSMNNSVNPYLVSYCQSPRPPLTKRVFPGDPLLGMGVEMFL